MADTLRPSLPSFSDHVAFDFVLFFFFFFFFFFLFFFFLFFFFFFFFVAWFSYVSEDTTTIIDGDGSWAAIKGASTMRTRSRTPTRTRSREAPGAPREALGQCHRRQGRRGHRDRDEEEPRRGRAAGHPRRPRGGHYGGGVALLEAADGLKLNLIVDEDEKTGAKIILRALEEPLRQIARNAGLEGSVVAGQRRPQGQEGLWPERRHRRDRRSRRGRRHRPGDGDALRAPERRVDRQNILTTEAIVAEAPRRTTEAAVACPTWAG